MADTIYHGDSAYDSVGQSVAVGDFNGDGAIDVAIGAPGYDGNAGGSGGVFVHFGDTNPSGDVAASGADVTYLGPGAGFRAGSTLSNAGDIDGDGADDLLIGGVTTNTRHSEAAGGIAWLVLSGSPGTYDLADAYITFQGGESGAEFGASLAGVGDVNDDGTPDILIGSPGYDGAFPNVGAAYLYTDLPLSGPAVVTLAEADAVYEGALQAARTGASVGAAGDVNGDGVADFGIGAPTNSVNGSKAGAAFFFHGGASLSTGTMLVDFADTTLRGNQFDRLGGSIGDVGDLNADGVDEMAVGAKQWGSSKRGATFIVYGTNEAVGATNVDSVYDHRIRGTNANDLFGASISGRVDFNNDGFNDLLIGATNADGPSGTATGAAWVIQAPYETEIVVGEVGAHWAQHRSANGGHAVAAVPDINGDGFGEVLIGSFQSTHLSRRRTGLAALFFGGEDVQDEIDWYPDTDGDGYGDSGATPLTQCEPPVNHVDNNLDCNDSDGEIRPYAIEDDCGSLVDLNCDGSVGNVDLDGDGVDACDGDCDDTDPLVNPNAEELCFDGIDNDCANEVDDQFSVDAQVWAADFDGDGYGDSSFEVVACEDPGIFLGTVVNLGGDCDDFNPAINAGAAEFCDEVDNNCDGFIDEDSSIDATPWYADDDGDLYGDRFDQVFACLEPAGYIDNFNDCDDTNADVAPGATEVCDFIDNDCDGLFYMGGPVEMDEYVLRLTGEDIFGRLGREAAAVPDYTGDGLVELAVAAPFSNNVGAEAGAVYIREGQADGGDFDLAEVRADGSRRYDVKITPEQPRGLLGSALASGDFNGDGFGDIVMGAYLQSRPASASGAMYVMFGPLDGEYTTADADVTYTGASGGDHLGIDIAVGDVDGDGFDDILVGADGADGNGDRSGEAYLIYGGPSMSGGIISAVADATLGGDGDVDRLGQRVAFAGDVNGDGFDDFMAAAPLAGPLNQGEVHLVLGSATRFSGSVDANTVLFSDLSNRGLGIGMNGVGDLNADGFDDLVLGTKFNVAYVVYGTHQGVLNTGRQDIADVADVTINGEPGDLFGYNIAGAGDVNGDGFADMALSATTNDAGGRAAGATYLIYGKRDLPGIFSTDQIESYGRLPDGQTFPTFSVDNLGGVEGAFIFSGEGERNFGSTIVGASDMNSDGFDDFLIGAAAAEEGRGQVVLMYGSPYGQDWDVGETGGGWSEAIEVDGDSSDWTANATFETTQGGATAGMITWTDDELFIGSEIDTVSSGGPSHFFVAYIGDSSGEGTTTGITFNTQAPGMLFGARYALAWRADDAFKAFYEWNGTDWVLESNPADILHQEDNGNGVVEFSIPMDKLGNPSRLDIATTWLFEGGGFESTFGGVPSVAYNNGDYDPNFAEYYGFALDADLGPASYGTLPTGGGAPVLDGTWETYCWNMDLDPRCSDELIVFQSCPMHAPISFTNPNDPQILGIPIAIGVQDDCDDRNPRVHPLATEIEGNSVDEDCDGADGSNAPPFITAEFGELFTNSIAFPNLEYGDPDEGGPNETPLVVTYEWTVTDAITGDTTTYPFFSLDGDFYFDKGDTVTFDAQVSDGATTTSTQVVRVVQNSPPQVIQCKLLPQDPTIDETITAVPEYWDEDRDLVIWTYQWANGGVIDAEETGGSFPGSKTRSGIGIAVSCTADDGEDQSTDVSTPVFPYEERVEDTDRPGGGGDSGDADTGGSDTGGLNSFCPSDRFEGNNNENNATDLFGFNGGGPVEIVRGIPMFCGDGICSFQLEEDSFTCPEDCSGGDGPALDGVFEDDLTICRGDEDWFSVPIDPLTSVEVDIDYSPRGMVSSYPALCAELWYDDPSFAPVPVMVVPCQYTGPSSTTFFSGDFPLPLPGDSLGQYYVRVYADGPGLGAGYDYDISMSIFPNFGEPTENLGGGCVDGDTYESNDTIDEASALGAGSYAGLTVCPNDPGDFYAVDLLAGDSLTASASFDLGEGDVDIAILNADGEVLVRRINDDEAVTEVSYWTANSETVYVRVFQDEGGVTLNNPVEDTGVPGVVYDLDVSVAPLTGCALADDSEEDNDTAATATEMFDFDFAFGLTACGGDPDWFEVRFLNGGEVLDFNVYFDDFSTGQLALTLYDTDGTTVLHTAETNNFGRSGGFVYTIPADGDYFVKVEALWGNPDLISVDGIDYDVETSTGFSGDPSVCTEDYLETNNTPADATPVGPGLIEDLSACQVGDRDWYAIDVRGGETLQVIQRVYEDCTDFGEGPLPQGVPCGLIVRPEFPTNQFGIPTGQYPEMALGLFDASGRTLDMSMFWRDNRDRVRFTAPEDMTVYIQSFLLSSSTEQAPRYDLDIQRMFLDAPLPPTVPDACVDDADEDDDLPGSGFFLSTPAAGDSVTYSGTGRTLCTDDDVFDIYLPVGSLVEVEINFDHSEGDVDVWGRQEEGPGEYIWRANSVSTDSDEAFTFVADVSANHAITVLLFDDLGPYQEGNTYDYSITVTVPSNDSGIDDSGFPDPDTYDTDAGCMPYEHTIIIDGSDEDWLPTEMFRTTSRGDSVTMFSWDETYFYFGARHSVIEFGGDDDIFNVYFGDGTAAGFDYGIHHGEQEADLIDWTATDVVRWKADGQFSALHRSRDYLLFSYWDIYPNYFQANIDGSQVAWDTQNQVVEFAIPRSEVNFNNILKVAAIWYHEGEEDPFAFAATPDNMFFEYTFDPDIASHLEFDACRPGGPRGAQLLGQGIGVACYDTDQYEPNDTFAASTEGLLGNQLGLGVCDDVGDFYTVFLAGTMDVSASYDPALGELFMTVYDADQNEIGSATGSGGFVEFCFDESTQAHGNYFVQVHRDEVNNGNEPTIYDLDVQSSDGATCSSGPVF